SAPFWRRYVPSCAASKRADYRPTRSFAQRGNLPHILRSRHCGDSVCFLRVFCRVGNEFGRRTLDPQRSWDKAIEQCTQELRFVSQRTQEPGVEFLLADLI